MKFAVKRKGFCPKVVEKLAVHSNHAVWAVVCLANESCAIGDEHPCLLRSFLTRCFRKYTRIYGVYIDLKTGEVVVRSPINRCYKNRSNEVSCAATKKEILKQLEKRFWWYLYERNLKLWIRGLEAAAFISVITMFLQFL